MNELAPLRNLGVFGYSMQVCRTLIMEMQRQKIFSYHARKYQVYIDAEISMLLADPMNIEKYMSGWHVHYRNHKKDRKGKLIKVEAFLKP